ncbi:cysteine desulfurase NifS [bacterium]|nr:MAG: cysteine desulfurase NifS [bacterium]
MRKVYMDHSATTPTRPEVVEAMLPFFTEQFGNPSSLHQFGQWTRAAVEEARDRVAKLIGAESEEVFFTSGGTESDNMVIKGVGFKNIEKRGHIITSKIEHHAVLEAVGFMEKLGFDATYLDVDGYGFVSPDTLREAIRDDTILISVMMTNNEVGTIEPIRVLADIAREREIPFHTDAVQSFGKIPVDVEELGIDFLASSGHKFYGPKGVGICYMRKSAQHRLVNFVHGGSHESGKRAGTENIPGIIGFAKALELAVADLDREPRRQAELADMFYRGLRDAIDGVELNGPEKNRLPGLLNISFDKIEGESLLISLDMQGIAASSGSACTSETLEASHVLTAMHCDPVRAHSSLRFSLGRENTEEDIEYVLRVLPPIVEKLRSVSML